MKKLGVGGVALAALLLLLAAAFSPWKETSVVEAEISGINSSSYLPQITFGQPPSCRIGVNWLENPQNVQVDALPLGWYVNYKINQTANMPEQVDFISTVNIRQLRPGKSWETHDTDQEILAAVQANPGIIWLIGNEPDRRDEQNDLEPDVYAAAYAYLYDLIKGADPTAEIYAGTIVQPTPIRLEYLDRVLAAYAADNGGAQMPVDGWSIHNFLLNEWPGEWGADIPPGTGYTAKPVDITLEFSKTIDAAIFQQRIVDFRQWMNANGYTGLPLSVTEYGVLMPADIVDEFGVPFSHSRVNEFMDATFTYMRTAADPVLGNPHDNNKLVQKWSWYSTGAQADLFNGELFDQDKPAVRPLSVMGQNFAQLVYNKPMENDFQMMELDATVTGGVTNTVTLTATVSNAGSYLQPQLTRVQFYNGDPQAGGTPIGAALPVSIAGCGDWLTVSLDWADVAPGSYQIYAVVDPDSLVLETDETDNMLHTSLNVGN